MNPDLDKLIRLQRAESALKYAEASLAAVPGRLADLEAALRQEKRRLDEARSSLDDSQKARRRLEGELQDLEARRSRYKGQLMEVKTNKEYTAMLHEIEGVEREIRGREDLVLAEMERAEALEAEVRREEQAVKGAEDAHRQARAALDQEAARFEAEAGQRRQEREAVAGSLPADLLELFQRVARLRGVALAEAKDAMCEACHLKLQVQMYVDLKRNEEITQCPACHRILYVEPPVPVTVVEP
jgi:predicted  nucleic acid-binding Zn-ribbon protein